MSKTYKIARCPMHGLHGARDQCYVCEGPVDQVEMVEVKKPKSKGVQHPGRIKATAEQLQTTVAAMVSKYKAVYVYSHSKPWRPPAGRGSSDVSDPTGSTVAEGEAARQVLDEVGAHLAQLVEAAKKAEGKLFALVKAPDASTERRELLDGDEKEQAMLYKEIRDLEEHKAELSAKLRACNGVIESKRSRAREIEANRDRADLAEERRKRDARLIERVRRNEAAGRGSR